MKFLSIPNPARGLCHSKNTRPQQRLVQASKYAWTFKEDNKRNDRFVQELPLTQVIRPFEKTRSNNEEKVVALMESISDIGLQEPIDVLDVEGKYYGFSGCHRYEAHKRLGLENIKCRVRKATKSVLRLHMM